MAGRWPGSASGSDDDAAMLDALDGTALNGIDSSAGSGAREYVERGRAGVDAKRRRLERHRPEEHPFQGVLCGWCSVPSLSVYQPWPCLDIRDDAAPYAELPGYPEGWRMSPPARAAAELASLLDAVRREASAVQSMGPVP